MGVIRDAQVFKAFENNYWEYYRELEKEFLQTQKYVEFCEDNNAVYSIEYLKLYQAVCSEIDVVGKVLAQAVSKPFIPEERKNNIYKWWYEIQDLLFATEGPFTYMNLSAEPKRISIQDYKCLLMDKIELHPWYNFRIEKGCDKAGRVNYKLVNGYNVPQWWSDYNKVKHNRIASVSASGKNYNYPKANFGNLCNAFAALYVLEKAFMDMVGTHDDLSSFMDFSELFVRRKRYTYTQMDEMFKVR